MGLFRPYEPGKPAEKTAPPAATTAEATASRTPSRSGASPAGAPSATRTAPVKKSVPTPSRREAEAARRQRLNPVRTPKEARAYEREQQAKNRQRQMSDVENRPEMQLLRDHVDARWNVGEFILPAMIVALALSMLGNTYPPLVLGTMVITWAILGATLIDMAVMWRGFKRLLAERFPRTSPKGMLMVAVNRAMQIRRFRRPPARIKRGDTY